MLGAIGNPKSIKILSSFIDENFESEIVVRETCELAISKIEHEQSILKSGVYDPIRCDFLI